MLEELLTAYVPERFLNDEKYRRWHIRGINPLPGVKVMGLHIPELREIAAGMIKEGQTDHVIREFRRLQSQDPRSGLCYEEKMLWGILVNGLPLSYGDRLRKVRGFVPVIDNWCVCDVFCSDARWYRRNEEETWKFLQRYFHSTKEFEVRFAIVFTICNYLNEKYIDSIFEIISELDYGKIESEYDFGKVESEYDFGKVPSAPERGIAGGPAPFYVHMAVAWLMATVLYEFPEKTRKLAGSGVLPDVIIRLYVRKAKESLRTKNVSAL